MDEEMEKFMAQLLSLNNEQILEALNYAREIHEDESLSLLAKQLCVRGKIECLNYDNLQN